MKTKLTKLFIEFFESKRASGVILILCTIFSIAIANSDLGKGYLDFWHTKIGFEIGETFFLKYSLEHWINDGLMAIFFLLIGLTGNWTEGLITSNSLGIFAGLLVGKPLGIALFSFLAVKIGLSELPEDVLWKHIIAVGFLGGIGFTMSIFITVLAFDNAAMVQSSKISILLSSLVAGVAGFLIFNIQKAGKSDRSA